MSNNEGKIWDLLIVGADAAGLTAGIYAGRKNMDALIVTEKLGGQSLLAGSIENYPGFERISGGELNTKIRAQVDNFGVEVVDGEKIVSISKDNAGVIALKSENNEYRALSVILATGRRLRFFNVPGRSEFMGKGISTCATCDAPFYKNKDVAVIGGGNAAFNTTYDLLDFANKIYVLQHREKFIGDANMKERLEKSGKVEFLTNAETREIKGTKFVESLVFEDLKTKETKELQVGGVFINIGQVPNSAFAKNFLEVNERNEIKIDHKTNETSVSGVFAAGDVSDVKHKQYVVAAGEGSKALLSAQEYLKKLGK